MAAKASRRLVIDASIARAAGGETATFPLSKRCRDFLKAVLDTGHHAVMTTPVGDEWKKHASRFAMQWRTAMVARKRVEVLDVEEDVELRAAVEDAAESDRARDAMIKDVHMVEAARVTDKTVVSLDDTVRTLFAAASRRVRVLKVIVWVNPGHEGEQTSAWLSDGAKPEPKRRLSAWSR